MTSWERLAFFAIRVALGLGAALAVTYLPHPFDWVILGALVIVVLDALYAMRPGPCTYCGRYGLPFPVNDEDHRRRAWWDLRAPIRRGAPQVWVCSQHLLRLAIERAQAKATPNPDSNGATPTPRHGDR